LSFLEVLVHDLGVVPALSGLCAGFELGKWRAKRFSEHLMEWLPEFALTYTELDELDHSNALRFLRKAAQVIYNTDKYSRRGEFGELILHAVIRQTMQTFPAISKVHFKDSANDTVKGFDCVHVVATQADLELWLGEAKFYADLSSAMNEAVSSLKKYFAADYLHSEFQAIVNKIDTGWPHADRLKQLLDPNTSLDQVFDVMCIPVLLTYDSDTVGGHAESTAAYKEAVVTELRAAHETFAGKDLPDIRVHLFLIPLGSKETLIAELHERLKALQAA